MCYYPFFRTDLPDDDYTTLVPPIKQTNGTNKRLPPIPIIIENTENNLSLIKSDRSNRRLNDQQKTTITEISRRRSSFEPNVITHPQSAPTSPALSQRLKQQSQNNNVHRNYTDIDSKSVSSDHGSSSTSGPNNCLSSGTLEIRLKFDAKNSRMWVFVIKATLEMNQYISKQTLIQIHLTMLPNKRIRFRTRTKPGDNAMFAEEFFCKVSPESIQSQGIRFRLYTYERFKREKLLAEATVMFGLVNLDEDMCKIISLERAFLSEDSDVSGNRSSVSNRTQSRQNSITPIGPTNNSNVPEIEISLAYDKHQAVLILEIGKGMNFGMSILPDRPPDTFVQIALLNSSGEEMVSHRTATRRMQHHPIFSERYSFNVHENLLNQVTLLITVFNKRPIGKHDRNLGWILFGHGTSGNGLVAHWDSMLNAQGETITRWHTLLES